MYFAEELHKITADVVYINKAIEFAIEVEQRLGLDAINSIPSIEDLKKKRLLIIRDTKLNRLENLKAKMNKIFGKIYDDCNNSNELIANNEKSEVFNKLIEQKISKLVE